MGSVLQVEAALVIGKLEGKGKGNHGCLRGFCFNC